MYASAVRDVWARGGARPTLPYDPAHSRNKGTPMLDTIALGGRGGGERNAQAVALLAGAYADRGVGTLVQACADRAAFWDDHWKDVFRCDVCLEHKPGSASCAARAAALATTSPPWARITSQELLEYVEILSRTTATERAKGKTGNKGREDTKTFDGCAHMRRLCASCCSKQLAACLGDAAKVGPAGVACVQPGCHASYPPRLVAELLSRADLAKLVRFMRAAFLRARPGACWCPADGCRGVVVVGDEATPPTHFSPKEAEIFARVRKAAAARCDAPAAHAVCRGCLQLAHGGGAGELAACRAASEARSATLRTAKGWPRCPNCKMVIEKSEGCSHMTCRCGTEFTYELSPATGNQQVAANDAAAYATARAAGRRPGEAVPRPQTAAGARRRERGRGLGRRDGRAAVGDLPRRQHDPPPPPPRNRNVARNTRHARQRDEFWGVERYEPWQTTSQRAFSRMLAAGAGRR